MNEHPPGNIFTSENKSVPKSLPAVPKKPSLPTSNPLESTKSACNRGNPSRNDFEGQSLINALNKFDAKIITDITYVQGVHTIGLALENNDPVAQQIAEVPVLLPKKVGEKSANTAYKLQDGPLGFPLWIDLHAMSTLCNQQWLSQTAVDACISLMCRPSSGVQILSSTWDSDEKQKVQSRKQFARNDIDTILLPVVFSQHWVAVSVSVKGEDFRITTYNSIKRFDAMMERHVNKIVGVVRKELGVDSNLKSYKVEFGQCSQQIDTNECGIHTIANLVFLAQRQEPSISSLDFQKLRLVYAKACCSAFVSN